MCVFVSCSVCVFVCNHVVYIYVYLCICADLADTMTGTRIPSDVPKTTFFTSYF